MAEKQSFSVRMNARTLPQLGMEDMPSALRISLWNIIEPWIWKGGYADEYERRAQWVYNFHAIRWPTDEIPPDFQQQDATKRLKQWMFSSAQWHDIYDLVEAIPEMILYGVRAEPKDLTELKRRSNDLYVYAVRKIQNYSDNLNAMLEREGAPYRYRNLTLIPITNEQELEELSQALHAPFQGARLHIVNATAKLSQRPEPDFRNSIKESVSAIESLLQESTGLKGERLPKLLDAFESKYKTDLHGAFKASIASLYGWTSDDGGIRHGIFGEETVGRAEAQFMLIACSALVNFLATKAE